MSLTYRQIMGKSAKTTRGGNKHRINVGRQKAKLAAAGVKDHTAYSQAAAAVVAAQKAKQQQHEGETGASNPRELVKQQMAASLKAIQRQRETQQAATTAVKMAPRPKSTPSTSAAGKKQ
jgi:hypothetical protein